MSDLQRALDEMGKGLSDAIGRVRADVRAQAAETHASFTEVRGALKEVRKGLEKLETGLERQDVTTTRLSHTVDQGFAHVETEFRRHRENVGTVLHTFVEDLHAVKADVRDVQTRLARLEEGRSPAA